jgi:hypothetical protein
MVFACMRIAAASLGAVILLSAATPVLAQSGDPKAGPRQVETEAKKEGQRLVHELAEAAKVLGGPAAQPECVWHGRRVIFLMRRDDVDTAFRHLDLYDRFGCPGGHIQAAFRCLLLQGDIDPKLPDAVNARIHACWVNPELGSAPPTAAAAPSGTTNR